MAEQLTRTIRFHPAWDKRHDDPNKNYGVGSAEFGFYLKGSAGTIQFTVMTGWCLPHVPNAKVLPCDWGYHAKKPQYEGHKSIRDNCEWVDEGPCYYDGSSLAADEVFALLVSGGDEAVWKIMEERYREQFGD